MFAAGGRILRVTAKHYRKQQNVSLGQLGQGRGKKRHRNTNCLSHTTYLLVNVRNKIICRRLRIVLFQRTYLLQKLFEVVHIQGEFQHGESPQGSPRLPQNGVHHQKPSALADIFPGRAIHYSPRYVVCSD